MLKLKLLLVLQDDFTAHMRKPVTVLMVCVFMCIQTMVSIDAFVIDMSVLDIIVYDFQVSEWQLSVLVMLCCRRLWTTKQMLVFVFPYG